MREPEDAALEAAFEWAQGRPHFVAHWWRGSLDDLADLLDTDRRTAAQVALRKPPRDREQALAWVIGVSVWFNLDPFRVGRLARRLREESA